MLSTQYEVGVEVHHGRVVKGSGYPVLFPFIDLAEVSAGGGTIIWRDEAGALRVGPLSAGADPGPASYGRGGDRPTIADANLVLGRLGDSLAGGLVRLRKDLALRALSALGDPYEVASEALRLAVLEMARAVRLVTVERGLDPLVNDRHRLRGAGPQLATELVEEMGASRVLVPPEPGLFSALGLLMADVRYEAREAYPRDVAESLSRLEAALLSRLGRVDYFVRLLDVRYEGQGQGAGREVWSQGGPGRLDQRHRVREGAGLEGALRVAGGRVRGRGLP